METPRRLRIARACRATVAVLPWLTAALVSLGAPLGAQQAGTGVSIQILEQHPDRLRLAYSIGSSMNNAMPEGGPISAGLLGSLCKTGVVGIPLAGEVELEIVEVSRAGTFDLPVLPDGEWDLRLDGPVFLGEPGFVRNQRVVQVNFAPRAVDGGSQVQLFSRVVADLRFAAVGSRPGYRHPLSSWEEQFYKLALINYEQAIGWRQTPAAAKPVADGTAPDRLRITVRHPGIHRLTGADLAEAGVSLSEIDPDAIRLWYGGGFTLGLSSRPHFGASLREIPITVDDDDGRFDSDDAVMFYGEPAERWVFSNSNGGTYSWRQNPYTRDNVYFLEWAGEGSGLRAGTVSGALSEPDVIQTDRYRERIHEEKDSDTFIELRGIKSGYDWYWETFRGNVKEFTSSLWDVVPEEAVVVNVRFWGFSEGRHQFEIKWNDRTIGVRSFSGSGVETLLAFARRGTLEGANQLNLSHQDNTATRLDWYELEYSRLLRARDGALSFDWLGATGLTTDEVSSANSTAQFLLSGFEEARPRIFEFRAPRTLKEIVDFEYDDATGSATFQGQYTGFGTPPQFLAMGDDGWKRPATIEAKRHARLKTSDHGAEYVIITHEDFRAAADKLAAWRAVDDRFGPPLTTHVADVEDVYDEFSGGLVDPMAIRSFVNFAVDNWDPAPVFILLMGDGSYDYRNNFVNSHPNWIPPYQDGSSMYDEWYVRIEGGDDLPDLAIGRLPVGSASEADAVVDKLIAYDRDPEIGPWQTRVLLVADDRVNPSTKEDEAFFVRDAERMAAASLPPDLDVLKLYFGEFQLEGRTKPTARDAFVKKFNEGALILTYIGHGNPETIAHEQVFVLSRDIERIDNGRRLPLMYTAASQVGVFDEPSRRSMPEVLINDPDGGVIGFISATRVGIHISNMNLAREFHETMYTGGDDQVPVGLALTTAKQRVLGSAADRVNIQRYSLLGDPAQILNRPFLKVQIEAPDSFKAFEEVHVQGRVQDASGIALTDFVGEALVQVFDSAAPSLTEGNRWEQPGAPIFRSLTPVRDGVFEAVFRVPRGISYGESKGRISAYVWGEGMPTAFGSTSGIEIGGSQPGIAADDDGPTVTLAFNGAAQFQEGGVVPNRSVLTASIEDGSGINITGEVGHEIELEIDDDLFTVTDLYNSQNGNYQTGMLQFELPALEPGSHDLSLRIWDNSNNSSRLEAIFQVLDTAFLSSVVFHPNPIQDQGHFTYVLNSDARAVSIKVFTLSGRLVDELEGDGQAGYNQVSWELPAGLANGAYLYRIQVTSQDEIEFEATSVIQVLR
jgi:hypothetical protein